MGCYQYFNDCYSPLDIDAFEKRLGNYSPDAVGQGRANLSLFSYRKYLYYPVDSLWCALCMEGGKNEMARRSSLDRQADCLEVSHFAHEDNIGVLAQ